MTCYTTPTSKFKYCDDGYLKQSNDYKILHITEIENWMESRNPAKQTQGRLWYDVYLGLI